MAEEVAIPGTGSTAKIRSPWAAALLPIVTLGIYGFVWYYKINREMADLGRAKNTDELGDSPGKSLVAITIGWVIVVPAVLSLINTGKRVQAAQRLSRIEPQLNGWLAIVMGLLISPVLYAYEQSELNKVWARVGEAPRVDAADITRPDLGPGATTPSQSGPETSEFR
jgi:hypothetical protein